MVSPRAVWWLTLAIGGCAGDLYRNAGELLDAEAAAVFRRVSEEPTAAVQLEERLLETPRGMIEFLLEELPFTAACVRALGQGRYEIGRRGRYFRIDDGQGMVLQLRKAGEDARRKVYVGTGTYGPSIHGEVVVILVMAEEGKRVRMGGRILLRLTGAAGLLGSMVPGFLERLMKRKGALFVSAAATVAQEASGDVRGFVERMRGAEGVSEGVLEKFARLFVR